MANHDRVSDLYYGRLDRGKTQEACRDRVHWLCERVRGERVLDIGCSQGVVSILLGREGHRVVGVDIEPEGIESALAALSGEPQPVQERVSFRQLDVFKTDFGSGSFDSAVMGEVLEHLIHPDLLLDRVNAWLVEGGRVVVSVPLGYHPFHDHKQTFYLHRFVALLSKHFTIDEVTVLHERYLCGVASKPPGGMRPTPPPAAVAHDWTVLCDRALESIQRRHHEEKLTWQAKRLSLRERLETQRQAIEQMRGKTERFEEEHRLRERAERKARYLKNRLDSTEEILNVRMNEIRYRLGDALVRAFPPSIETLRLPGRLMRLFLDGLGRRRARRRAATGALAEEAEASAAGTAALPRLRALPPWLADLRPNEALAGPFSAAPRELIVRPELRIAAVMDEFSWRAWQYEADLYTFTPLSWRQALEAKPPHLLLVESTWHGLENGWHFQVRDLGKRPDVIEHYALPEIVAWCRERGIPTVFYNKEDPPNFEFFLDAARLFDVIFTSDANCITDYRERIAHQRVHALPFAAQPRIHNPIYAGEREGNVCFAGTWYNHRHQQRRNDAEAILGPALGFGLHIFDRMADSPSRNYHWPAAYERSVYGALPYATMVTAYKRFRVFLNLNSVADSPTMFARRVFELLASATPVISSESRGIRELLGEDLVPMSADEGRTRALLQRLLGDEEHRARLALRGQRAVFCKHTYTHRLEAVLKAAEIEAAPLGRPRLTAIACAQGECDVEAIAENFGRQAHEPAGLIVCTKDAALASRFADGGGGTADRGVVCRPRAHWGELLAEALERCAGSWAAAINPGDYYGAHYLTDYANATLYLDGTTAIGKSRLYCCPNGESPTASSEGVEYRFVESLHPWTVCVPAGAGRAIAEQLRGCDAVGEWWERLARSMDRRYAADRFNYVQRPQSRAERAATGSAMAGRERETRALSAALA